MRRLVQGLAAAAILLLVPLAKDAAAAAADRAAAYYPLDGRRADPPAPPLGFTKSCDATVPGSPVPGTLEIDEAAQRATFRTSEGGFVIDLQRCSAERTFPAPSESARAGDAERSGAGPAVAPAAAGSPPTATTPRPAPDAVAAARPELRTPPTPFRSAPWETRLAARGLGGLRVDGPGRITAILTRDGTISGREARYGHLLWRTIADHRLSGGGARAGMYLLVAPDASRTLSAYRYADGTLAGAFRLDSEDAAFASSPVVSGSRVSILAVVSPRPESRFLTLLLETASPAPSAP